MHLTKGMTLTSLALTTRFAPPDARAGGTAALQPIAEIVTFRLIPGTEDAAFQSAAQATAAPVAAQPGFLRRSLSRDETGLWTDYVEWADAASATAAAQRVMRLPEFGPFGAAIDPEGMVMRHAPVLLQIAR
jgi:quinol monooxygenase YgiN